jgi:transcriptional regulator with XRE-family HTH domain
MSSSILEKFANRLKFLRKKKNLSQEQLALKSNVDRTYIGRIERLERNPSLDVLNKIANGFGMTLKELFDF